ncbi:MAG: hypothetical protein E7302_06120 [Butyrivibrio sp.]|nr:hypothetical protein [Butyrivibrio sp.]
MVSSDTYFGELLRRYQANFDITEKYTLGDRTYPAYAYFCSLSEKYVLRKEAQLWAIKAYEHVLFENVSSFNTENLSDIKDIIEGHMEPELVRKGQNYPEKDHMCTYMTFVIVSDTDPTPETIRAIKKFKYDRGYMFNFRGHSEARLILISLSSGNVYSNYCGRDLRDLLSDVYEKVSTSVEAAS